MAKPEATPHLPCNVCGAGPTKSYQVVIDGEPLLLVMCLCQEHGDQFVFDCGVSIGGMLRDRPPRSSG